MAYSILQIFPSLEAKIREYVPRCAFFFGEDDIQREAQPPKIVWDVDTGDPGAGIERQNPSLGHVSPRSFDADMVQVAATCYGAAAPSTATNEKDMRRQAFAASEQLMHVVRWALKGSSSDAGWLGIHEILGWQSVEPSTTDRTFPIELRFTVKVQLVEPSPILSDPPHTAETTLHLES